MMWDSLPVVAHPLPCHGQSYGWRRRKLAPVCTGLAVLFAYPLFIMTGLPELEQLSDNFCLGKGSVDDMKTIVNESLSVAG